MEIKVTGDPVIDNLKNRKGVIIAKIRELAYERLGLTRRLEDIDKTINQLEGAQAANDMVQKDIDTREAIAKAQEEAAEKKAAEEKTIKEVK